MSIKFAISTDGAINMPLRPIAPQQPDAGLAIAQPCLIVII